MLHKKLSFSLLIFMVTVGAMPLLVTATGPSGPPPGGNLDASFTTVTMDSGTIGGLVVAANGDVSDTDSAFTINDADGAAVTGGNFTVSGTSTLQGHVKTSGGIGAFSTVTTNSSSIANGGNGFANAFCPLGQTLIGCGYSGVVANTFVGQMTYSSSILGNYCSVQFYNNSGVSKTFTAQARCFNSNG